MNTRCFAGLVVGVASMVAAAGSAVALEVTPSGTTAAVVATATTAAEDAAGENTLAKLASERSKSAVTIKFINKGDGEDQEVEVPGTMISGDGLVLTSNFFFPDGGSPSEIKVLVGDDTQGVDAKFVARDSELALAWVRVDAKPSEAYAFVDFSKGATVELGDEIFTVRKMGKFFGQAPIINEGEVAAITTKPRALIIPNNGLQMRGEIALPVYTEAGEPVGLTTFIMPEEDEMGGAGNPLRGAEAGMILSAKDVAEATAKAIENSASAAEAPSAEPAASTDGVQPAGEKKPE
jgi:hypothetical protein